MSILLGSLNVIGAEIITLREPLKGSSLADSQTDGTNRVDVTNQIEYVDYFEDILSPVCYLNIKLNSSNSLFSTLPIRGGEKVVIKLDTAQGEWARDDDMGFYVYKVSDYAADGMKETFVLKCVSVEGLTNETTRCEIKFAKATIDQHVTKILKEILQTEKFEESNIEKTANTYTFIGNLKKPFHVLHWLAPKGVPVAGKSGTQGTQAQGTSGFLFYENKDGFNFKSIETLIGGTTNSDNTFFTYSYDNVVEHNSPTNDLKILDYKLNRNVDMMQSLRLGMYSNVSFFFDLYENKTEFYTYNLKDEIGGKLGTEDELVIPQGFETAPSRVLVRTADRGVLDPSGIAENSGRDTADMAKSFARYNVLFSQSLNMVVPCNTELKVGDVITALFPKVNMSNIADTDEEQSGKYLIKGLRHHFTANSNVTYLSLIRDSYGLY